MALMCAGFCESCPNCVTVSLSEDLENKNSSNLCRLHLLQQILPSSVHKENWALVSNYIH